MDHDYRVVARKNNFEINKRSGDDLAHFPIEKARFRSIWYVLSAAGLSMIGYGWSMQFNVVSFRAPFPRSPMDLKRGRVR